MKRTEKEKLIQYIKTNDNFYQFANMNGHSAEQLLSIKNKIQFKKKKKIKS